MFVGALIQRDRESTLRFQDVVRALVMLISDDLGCASVAMGGCKGWIWTLTKFVGLGLWLSRNRD